MDFKNSTLNYRFNQLKKCYDIPDEEGIFGALLEESKLYFDRYEKLRLLSVPEYSRIIKRNMKGENFDDIIDKL